MENVKITAKLLTGIFRPFSPIYLKFQISDGLNYSGGRTAHQQRNTFVIPRLLPGMEECIPVESDRPSTRAGMEGIEGKRVILPLSTRKHLRNIFPAEAQFVTTTFHGNRDVRPNTFDFAP